MVLRLPDSWSNWNLEMLVFEERGKTGVPAEKPLRAKERTNNKLNPHMALTPGFEHGPHWWEASALTTVPSLALHVCTAEADSSLNKPTYIYSVGLAKGLLLW